MKISILGNNLSALTLAKILSKKKIKVDIISENKKALFLNSSRTIGITQSNISYLEENFNGIKNLGHNIDKITISTFRQKNDVLNFSSSKNFQFSVFEYKKIYQYLNSYVNKDKNIKTLTKNFDNNFLNNKFLNKYNIIIDTNLNNPLSRKFFSKKIEKDYFSKAFVTIIKHKKINNNIAKQIFTSEGPLAFLPISNNRTSIVYSIFDKNSKISDKNKIIELIKYHNTKYKIQNFSDIQNFKLNFSLIRNYYKENILAFGDKIHTIHPLAGQGFNMTLRDIKTLSKILDNKIDNGLTIDISALEKFEESIKYKNTIFANSIDWTYEFFSFEKKLPLFFSKNLFKFLDTNKVFKKYVSNIANKGI